MKWLKIIRKSFQSLLLHRLRSLLSTLGILFGVVAVVAMLSIGEGAKRETIEQIEQLGINNIIIRQIDQSEEQRLKAAQKRSRGLTLQDAEAIKKNIAPISWVAPIKVVEAEIIGTPKEMAPEMLAVSPDYAALKAMEMASGRFISDRDCGRKELVCVLGADVASSLGKEGHVGQSIRIEGLQFQIVGVVQPRRWSAGKIPSLTSRNLNQTVFIPLGSHLSIIRSPSYLHHMLSEIQVQIAEAKELNPATQAIQRLLQVTHQGIEDYQIVVPQELLSQLGRTQRTFNLVLGSIAAISLLVGGIGIMNIMLATVSERTREIGIRRAIGANKKQILVQFLTETLLLTLAGAVMGIFIGILFSALISHVAGWNTIVTLWSVLLSLGMSSLVGLFSGLYPAMKAASMNPITALRHE